MTTDRRPRTITAIVLLAVLLIQVASVPAGGAIEAPDPERSLVTDLSISADETRTATSTVLTASRTIELTQRLHLTPDSPGEIAVTLQYLLPSDVVDLQTRLPSGATVTATNGFVEREGTEYAWDKQTAFPSLTYRITVNETLDVSGPIAGRGDHIFVDTGEWALVRVPRTATSWSWRGGGTVELSRSTTTAGPGAVGDTMAFLGEHREFNRTAHGQTFRLIVPTRAILSESPTDILDSMASASNTLQVGDRDDRVFMVAAPTRSTRWGVRGLQTGGADFWVRDSERLDTADNVWLHEYVHTRQGYTAANEVRWFTEASATYYAALLALEQNRIDFDAFRTRLALGTRTPDTNAILADSATWDTVVPYTKGALVAGELDRETRQVTDQSRSLQEVFSQMNSHAGPVTGSAFRSMVRQAGGDDTATVADRFTSTSRTPSMWNRAAHDRAFGTTPAQIGYSLPVPDASTGYQVSGPYRDELVGAEGPLRLAVGEALTFDVRVTNTGGTTGEYDAELLVNGDLESRHAGSLDSGESRTLPFTHRFSTVGEYTMAVGGDRVAVSVREPATPTVIKMSVTGPHQRQGAHGVVTVTATTVNKHSFPAATNLTLYQNGEAVETRRVLLPPDEKRPISFADIPVTEGDHVFRVGDQTATVTIESTPSAKPQTTSTEADGFGALKALLALISLLVILGRRQ